MTAPMPKDNEVDEKVTPVAWVERTEGGLTRMWSGDLSAWAHRPANPEPLYSAATVAELRAEVERLSGLLEEGGRRLIDENMRASSAERRVGELEALLDGRECATCTPNGVYSTDDAGPFDCYACGRKANG